MSKLEELGEFGLIDRLTRGLPRDDSVIVGIGDDCAVVRAGKEQLLFSCDAFIEDVHFRRNWASANDIGYKAASVALSDIAAMGGIARYMLVTLACPRNTDLDWLEQVYAGIQEIARMERVSLIGGDTAASRKGVVLDITVVGMASGTPVCRSGARAGDLVAVTGHPGCSALGLHALESGARQVPERLIKAHLRPRPKLLEGMFLGGSTEVNAMIDTSDGLVQDLGHIASRSGVSINIETAKLPLTAEQRAYAGQCGLSAVDTALTGGEDYELAFTVAPSHALLLVTEFNLQFKLPVTIIGEVHAGTPGITVNGKVFPRTGYTHFQELK